MTDEQAADLARLTPDVLAVLDVSYSMSECCGCSGQITPESDAVYDRLVAADRILRPEHADRYDPPPPKPEPKARPPMTREQFDTTLQSAGLL